MSGRKKSIASSGPNGGLPQIDTGVVNTLLKKPGSSAVPLYQQCTALRARLQRIHDFAPFLAISSRSQNASRQSVDPVHALWDCLALGTPLCFLFNLLDIPSSSRLDINCDPEDIEFDDLKQRKKATAQFIVGITTLQKAGEWDGSDVFTVSDLTRSERNTNGFVKVVSVLSQLLDRLPEHVYMEEPPVPTSAVPGSAADNAARESGSFESFVESVPQSALEAARKQVIAELLDTERKFVQDLEVMQTFAASLRQQNLMSQDTIHRLFLNVDSLLDFQRHFLISMEGVLEQKWPDQRWGSIFIKHEEDFEVYEPYCANFQSASELLQAEEQNLMPLADIIHPKSELPAFLIKPVQRICKYPLLLEQLAKRVNAEEYPHYDELLEGLASTKRVTDKVNEAERRAENFTTAKALERRVVDWKGYKLANFGSLLLDDIFCVNKSDVDREYHVFLFEKIILCCKEANPPTPTTPSRKVGKSNSLLKKSPGPVPLPAMGAMAKKRTTPLLLKGRIFLSNVTQAQAGYRDGIYGLDVWWRGDEGLEHFTLRCRTEEQMNKWQSIIQKLLQEAEARHVAERSRSPSDASSIHPSFTSAQTSFGSIGNAQMYPASRGPPLAHARGKDLQSYLGSSQIPAHAHSHSRSHSHSRTAYDDEGFAEDEFDDSPTDESQSRMSGFSSAASVRRPGSTPVPHPDLHYTNQDPRRATGDYPGNGYQRSAQPPLPRMPTPSSQQQQQRPVLRSQFSSVRLGEAYGEMEEEITRTRAATTGHQPERYTPSPVPSQHLRMRSASTPTAYSHGQAQRSHLQQQHAPPVPHPWSETTSTTSATEKRESGSSTTSSIERSSGYSSTDALLSPDTPYGSNDSNISHLKPATSTSTTATIMPAQSKLVDTTVKIKVHYRQDLFIIMVPRTIEYSELAEKVGRKIRLCGGDRDNSPLRLKYRDDEDDLITLGSDEDVQMAFDTSLPLIALYVT